MTNKHLIIPITLLIAVYITACSSNQPKNPETYSKIPKSILIVYESGEPYKTISDVEKDKVDAITGPTPTEMNIDIISHRLAQKLSGKYTIRLIRASEIKDYREILQYDMLVIGNPVYFWNINWKLKEMLDLNFEKIYSLRQDDFKKMKLIVFGMGQYGPSVVNSIKQIEFVMTDCSAKVDKSMVFITKLSMPQYDKKIEQLAFSADSIMKLK